MAVYDRSMFRGSRPTPQAQGAGDAVAEKFVSEVGNRVVSDAQQGIASAKDYVQVMNAMRGDQQTMKERRSELGGIVGMKDANKTPESVVTLVQPVMQMREAQGSVDDGIGQMAQKAMDTPVEGNMAGGIMQPLQLAPGGAVSLKRLYQENLPMMREIYGDQTADLKKQALGQLLLGGLAPAGLAIAQGTPVAEALMPIGAYSAQLAGDVSKAKRKQEAAERAGAFELAQAQQTAAAAKKAKEEEITYAPAGSAITKGTGEVIGYVPSKPQAVGNVASYKFTGTEPVTIDGFGTLQPGQTYSIGANQLGNQLASVQLQLEEVKEPPKPLAAGAQKLYKNTSDVAIETPGGTVQPGKEISLGSNELAKVTNRTALQPVTEDTSALTKDMVFKGPAVMNGVTYKAGDIVPPMSIKAYNALTEENPTLAGKMASLQAYDRDKLPSPEILFSVDANNNRIQKPVFTQKELSDALNEGFSTEDDSTYVPQPMVMLTPSGKTLTKTPKTLKEMKIAAGEGYVNFDPSMMRTVGNKLISVFPTGTQVNFSSMDPIPLFNSKGEKRVITNETELMAAYNAPDPFYLKTPPSKDVTKKKAYGELIPLTTKLEQWADGTPGVDWTPQDQKEFDTYLSAVQSATVIGPSAANPDTYEVQRPVLPQYIIGALAKANLKDPNFPTYGLLPVEQQSITQIAQAEAAKPGLVKEINYADQIGFGNWLSRNADRVFGVVVEGFGGNYSPMNPESSEAVTSMNALMVQSRTSALADLTGKQTEGIRKEINALLFDPASPFLTIQDAKEVSISMSDVLQQAIETKTVEFAQTNPSSTKRRDILKASIVNLTKLQAGWRSLAEDFSNVSRGTMDPNNLPRTTK